MKFAFKALFLSLFLLLSTQTNQVFAQKKATPRIANKKLKSQGFYVINRLQKTRAFIKELDGVILHGGVLYPEEGYVLLQGNNKDVLVNGVKSHTIRYPDGSSITRSCACSGGGSCDVVFDSPAGKYVCMGDGCCTLTSVRVSKDGDVDIETE